MDPFLEDPEVFPDLHDRFVTHLSERLQASLPPPYYAALGRRVWIEASHCRIGPDVTVRRGLGRSEEARGCTAVAAAPVGRSVVIRVPHDETREPFVEVYVGRRDERRLVTSIELLSPANKTPGEHGRELYLRKQQELLGRQVHLVEIDLLRGGQHTTAVPEEKARAGAGLFDYHATIHRFDRLEDFEVFPIRLEERLPAIPIPLLPGDGPVNIDLQALLDQCYDAGPYRFEIDYCIQNLAPPLSAGRREWAESLLSSPPA